MKTNCPKCNSQLNGRHCLTCGHSEPEARQDGTNRLVRPHKKPEPGAGDSLMRMLEKFSLTLPANAIEWRVKNLVGRLPQFNKSVTLLLTDGIVAWFLLDDQTPFFGHLAAFEERRASREKDMTPSIRKPKSKRQQILALL
jgi:hypothetical protein